MRSSPLTPWKAHQLQASTALLGSRSYLLEIGNPSKEWVLYHNLKRVGLEVIQVEHGDFFALFEKVPKKTRFPSSLDKATSRPASESIRNADQEPPAWPSLMSAPACLGLLRPPPTTVSGDQGASSGDQGPPLQLEGIPSVPCSDEARNYAETTPFQLQAELDDASVVSEDPKYGCDAGCFYCGQPCVRTKCGHVFHQCPEHYRWWRMHKH